MASKQKQDKEEEARVQSVKHFGLNAFMGILTSKKGIKTRDANYLRDKKVTYFRGKDFLKYVRDNGKLLQKKCPKMVEKVFDKEYPPTDEDLDDKDKALLEQKVRKLCQILLELDLVEKTSNDDINPEMSNNRPTRLKPAEGRQDFIPKNDTYYIIKWEGSKTFQHMMMALVIVGVLCCTMFSAWPIWAKVGVWYCTVSFCTFFAALLVVRLFCYVALWCIGIEFWIFPNLDDADLGILDSLKPFYSFERRRDGWFMLCLRLAAIAVAGTSSWQIAQSYSFNDGAEVITNMLLDINDWGLKRVTEGPMLEDKRGYMSIEDFHKMAEEEEEEERKEAEAEDDKDDDAEDVEDEDEEKEEL